MACVSIQYYRVSIDLENLENFWNFVNLENSWNFMSDLEFLS